MESVHRSFENGGFGCDEIKDAEESVSTNVRRSVAINSATIASTNFGDTKVGYKMYCYILHTVLLLEIILVFIITIICCHYANDRLKEKL